MARKPRNYKREYEKYQGRPDQIRRRSMRNKARRKMVKKHGRAKLRGKDVGHLRGIGGGNGSKNLRIQSKRKNRSFKRNSDGSVRKHPR